MTGYLCHKYRADTNEEIEANIKSAQRYAFFIQRMGNGIHMLVPHTMVQKRYGVSTEYNSGSVDEAIVRDCTSLLKMCDTLYVCGDTISAGMEAEIALAKTLGMSIAAVNSNWLAGAIDVIKNIDPDAEQWTA